MLRGRRPASTALLMANAMSGKRVVPVVLADVGEGAQCVADNAVGALRLGVVAFLACVGSSIVACQAPTNLKLKTWVLHDLFSKCSSPWTDDNGTFVRRQPSAPMNHEEIRIFSVYFAR